MFFFVFFYIHFWLDALLKKSYYALGGFVFPLLCYVALLCMLNVSKVKKSKPKWDLSPTETTTPALPETTG